MHEWSEYIGGCITRIGNLAARTDHVGEKARSEFGWLISALIPDGFFLPIEQVIHQVVDAGHTWNTALGQLKVLVARYPAVAKTDLADSIDVLINKLKPTSISERIRVLVTDAPMQESGDIKMSWEERLNSRCVIVHELAQESLQDLPTLTEIFPKVSRDTQFMADQFGTGLAKYASSPLNLLEQIVQAIEIIPVARRNYNFIAGFVAGIPEKFRDEVENFKIKVIESPELAPIFPMICKRVGLTREDITNAVVAMERDTLSPWDLRQWAFTSVLSSVSPAEVALLLDAMLNHSALSFACAVTILGRILENEDWTTNESDMDTLKLADLEPQLQIMVQSAGRWSISQLKSPVGSTENGVDSDMVKYYFEKIVNSMLASGRENPTSRRTALDLARALTHGVHDDLFDLRLITQESVIAKMLKDYSDIVWPIVGSAILKDHQFARRMMYALGKPYNPYYDAISPILYVPEDILFAWCYGNPDDAPQFMALCVPFLSVDDGADDASNIHPIMSRILDEFGEHDDVQEALQQNIKHFGGVSSVARHYSRFVEPLKQLEKHSKDEVRQWAAKMGRNLKRDIQYEAFIESEWETQYS